MRVLLVIGLLGGGGAERQLARFVERARDKVDLAGFVVNPGGAFDAAVGRGLARRYDAGGSRARKLAAFAAAVHSERPDVIHAWHTHAAIYPLLTWPLHRRPLVINVRGDLSVDTDHGRPGLQGAARLVPFGAATVANSPHLLEALRAAGLRVPRPRVIPNGIALPTLGARGAGTAGAALQLCGVGSLKPLKNWAFALDVVAALRAAGRDVRLTVYGEGPEHAALVARAAAIGLDGAATFPGFTADVSQRLTGHDLLLHPSRSEGLPNAVLEGLAAGLPAVTSDLAAYRDLRPNGPFLRTHPQDDVAACAAALQPWLDDAMARQAAGATGRAFVEATYSVEAMVEAFVAVYREVLGAR